MRRRSREDLLAQLLWENHELAVRGDGQFAPWDSPVGSSHSYKFMAMARAVLRAGYRHPADPGCGRTLQTYRDARGKFRWRLIAGNGSDILADSGQGYSERNKARKIAVSLFPGVPVVVL